MAAKAVNKISRIEKIGNTEKDSILDKEDIDREGVKVVYNVDNYDSTLESDKAEAEYEGIFDIDEDGWSDSGIEVRDNLGDED